jgi:hypothetical protein
MSTAEAMHMRPGFIKPAGITAVLASFSWMACAAAPPMASPFETLEELTHRVAVPQGAGDSIVARLCATCAQTLLRLTPETQYFVGSEAVTFDALAKFWREGGRNSMAITYDRQSLTVFRIIVQGKLRR